MSVFISSIEANLVDEGAILWRSEDWTTIRASEWALAVRRRLGRRVRIRCIWERWLTWKCVSGRSLAPSQGRVRGPTNSVPREVVNADADAGITD